MNYITGKGISGNRFSKLYEVTIISEGEFNGFTYYVQNIFHNKDKENDWIDYRTVFFVTADSSYTNVLDLLNNEFGS